MLIVSGCNSNPGPAKDLGADVDEVAATLVEQPLLHSTSIAVVHRGQAFVRHRGDMQAGKPSPPTDATLYEIGSLSKTLAGTLMANAVLERRVGLDDVGIRLDGAQQDRLAVGYHSDNPATTTPMPQLPWGASRNSTSPAR